MTRMDDSLPEKFYTADMSKPILQYRTDFANEIGADLFVSIHNNAYFSYVDGTETLYFNAGGAKGDYSKKVASIIHEDVVSKTKLNDKGLIVRNDLYVLKHTQMPAVLVEIGYMTNEGDAAKLKSDAFRLESAKGLYNGIVNSLKFITE